MTNSYKMQKYKSPKAVAANWVLLSVSIRFALLILMFFSPWAKWVLWPLLVWDFGNIFAMGETSWTRHARRRADTWPARYQTAKDFRLINSLGRDNDDQ